MISTSSIQTALWWGSPLLEFAIVTAGIRRKQIGQYPFFFLYVLAHFVHFWTEIAARRYSYSAYFYVYWSWMPIDAATTLLVIQELFSLILTPYRAIKETGVATFRIAAVALFGIAICAACAAPGNDYYRLISAMIVVDRSATLVEVGLLLVLFVGCAIFGINWKHYPLGIASGMAVIVAVGLANACLRAQLGRGADPWYGLVQGSAFNFGMGVWFYCFATVPSVTYKPDAEQISVDLSNWNHALEEILNANSPASHR